jgi:fermentation-respiration switch protein FrsA (DUF1100 family)
MPRRSRSSFAVTVVAVLTFAACTSGPNAIDKQLLTPPVPWLAEPADFGLEAEPVNLELHSEASLTGFWIPHANGEKRTVVLFHDGATNASVMHPYYRFLHDAGFQVLVFDPRGFGKSKGQPTLQAWLYDLPPLFRWLRARPDVDGERIALFGTGLGSVAALWAARTQGCQALVVEHLPSLREMLREQDGNADGSAVGALKLGFVEFSQLPEEIEPLDNAPRTKVPALFLASDGEPTRDRKALANAFATYAGPKQLWVLANTGKAPHGMLTHDGEYQTQIARFLQGALAGTTSVFTTAVSKADNARDGQTWWQIDITPPATFANWSNLPAIEVSAVLADGSVHFARTLAEGRRIRARMKLPSEPLATSAVAVPNATADATETWKRAPTPLARSGAAVDASWSRIEALRNDALPPADRALLRKELETAEATTSFPPALEAELADVFAKLGQDLAASSDANERAAGRALLQRAVAARPKAPHLHVWPGPTATYGFPQAEAVETAERLLAAPAK